MKKTLLSLSIAAAAVTMPTQAADIGSGLDLSGNLALTSMYIWRGNDQASNTPAVQGGLDLAHSSGVYAGTWASNVDWGSNVSVEVDAYVGYATELAGVGLDVGYLWYMYPGADAGSDFEELYVGASKEFGPVELGATYYFSDTTGYYDAWEVSAGTEVAGFGVGFTYGDQDKSRDYYSISVSKELLSDKWPVEVSLSYHEADYDSATGGPDSDGKEENVVFAISKSF
jgi:uncharacterized protein (TIGR02001 family)